MTSANRTHPVHIVHRVSAAVLGLALWVFAALGFFQSLPFLSTQGQTILGLSSDGALATISVIAGAILITGAILGGPVASTISIAMGTLFILSGIANLGVMDTRWNIFDFRLPNVGFSFVVGLVLLMLGLYGRVSGGLPADNPYRSAREQRRGRAETPDTSDTGETPQDKAKLLDAEIAMGEGHPSPEQAVRVKQDQTRRQRRERARAYQHWWEIERARQR